MKEKKPKFIYKSVCCNVVATKPPCERTEEERREHKFGKAGLGKWDCTKCGKRCVVTRHNTGE